MSKHTLAAALALLAASSLVSVQPAASQDPAAQRKSGFAPKVQPRLCGHRPGYVFEQRCIGGRLVLCRFKQTPWCRRLLERCETTARRCGAGPRG